jgi:hypothetical protein
MAPRTHTSGGGAAAFFNVSGSDWEISRNSSSKRHKVNIRPLVIDWDRYAQLAPSSFDPKKRAERAERDGRKAYHFIAEDMDALYPEATVYDEEGLPATIDDPALITLNTAAILDLAKELETLKDRIATLEALAA